MTEQSDNLDALISKKLAQFYLAISGNARETENTLRYVQRILEENAEVLHKLLNDTITDYLTDTISILHLAREYDQKDVFKYLIAQDANLAIQNDQNYTIVHLAIKQMEDCNKYYDKIFGKVKNMYVDAVLSKQLESGMLENVINNNGWSHLHIACIIDKTDIVKFFLNHREFVNRSISDSSTMLPGYTPLHLAVRYCACETVKVLLDYGADKYATDVEGISPLHLLLQWSMKIKDNINVDMPASYEEFIRDLESNESTIQMTYEKGMNFPDGLNSLHIAASMQDSEAAKKLLQTDMHSDCCIKSDAKLWPGYTALHFTAHFNIDTLKLFLNHGGDILIEDAKGFTPLDLCVQRYSAEQLHSILISQPIWKEIQFKDSQTKLVDLIFAMNDLGTLSEFLTSMSNINTSIPSDAPIWPGCSPLHLAVLFAERERDIKDLYEQTAYKQPSQEILNIATKEKGLYINRIKVCLSLNADVTVQDVFGNTPLHLAYRLGKVNAVKLLLEHHPKLVNPIDSGGLSHFHIACAAQKIELVDSLLFGGADVNSHIFPRPTSSAMLISAKKRPIPHHLLPVPLGSTPLHIAVKVQAEALIEMLVKRGADLYAKNADGLTPVHELLFIDSLSSAKFPILFEGMKNVTVCGFTPLLVSACKNNVDAVERILGFGVDVESAVGQVSTDDGKSLPVDLKEYRGYRALHFAVKNRSLRMVELLLKNRADVLTKSDDGSIPLYMSLRGDIDIGPFVKLLKSDHTLQKRVEEETGVTMLHVACHLRDVGLAEKALISGTDVNARTFRCSPIWPNSTPLHVFHVNWDVDKSSIGLLQTLLENGADVTMENEEGTPIWQCHDGLYCAMHAYEVMDLLMSSLHDYSVNPCFGEATHFHIACARNAVTQVEGFLKAGVDVNLTVDYFCEFESGMTPLHCALENNAMEAFDLLMKHGADVRIDDTHGDTPLHLAILSDELNLDLLDRIIRAGADVNALNIYGETPFDRLLHSGHHSNEMIKLFIRSADRVNFFNPVTNEGLVAIAFNHLRNPMEVVEMFVTLRDFLSVDAMGRNVLHNIVSKKPYVARSGTEYTDIVEKIASLGCDIDATDSSGRTPLFAAVQLKNYQGIIGLLQNGADMNVIDDHGNSAFSHSLLIKNSHRNYLDINLLFVVYVDMKQFVGLHCNRKDRESFDRALKLLNVPVGQSKYQGILDRLKHSNIASTSVNLYDFLSETGAVAAYPHMIKSESLIVDDFFQKNKRQLRQDYQMWSGLLVLQHRKAQARVALMEPAMNALRYLTESCLDELCYVRISRYLSNEDMKILIGSVSMEEE